MNLKFETWFDYLIFFIIIIKIIFVISAAGYIILSHTTGPTAEKLDPKLLYWKERTEFIFTICMALLLIYHFNPRFSKKPITEDTAILFFLFGCILIFTAKWTLFIQEAPWYKLIVSLIK
jgi:hypothetical protein